MTTKLIITFWLTLTFAGVSLMTAANLFGFSSLKASQNGIEFSGGTLKTSPVKNGTVVIPFNEKYKYTKTLENRSGDDWVRASCQSTGQRAISGLCVIDNEDGWGWVLQNAGITSETEWGCAYRRGVYVEGVNGTPGTKFNIVPPKNQNELTDWRSKIQGDVRGAASKASATATVLCLKEVEPVKEGRSWWSWLSNPK